MPVASAAPSSTSRHTKPGAASASAFSDPANAAARGSPNVKFKVAASNWARCRRGCSGLPGSSRQVVGRLHHGAQHSSHPRPHTSGPTDIPDSAEFIPHTRAMPSGLTREGRCRIRSTALCHSPGHTGTHRSPLEPSQRNTVGAGLQHSEPGLLGDTGGNAIASMSSTVPQDCAGTTSTAARPERCWAHWSTAFPTGWRHGSRPWSDPERAAFLTTRISGSTRMATGEAPRHLSGGTGAPDDRRHPEKTDRGQTITNRSRQCNLHPMGCTSGYRLAQLRTPTVKTPPF